MRVTLKDVARECGVSPHTVSDILRRKPKPYKPETVQRVREAARKLGYRLNAAALAMRRGSYGGIGFLVPSTSWGGAHAPHSLLAGIQEGLAEADYYLVPMRVSDDDLSNPTKVAESLQRWSVDGFLVNYHYGIPTQVSALLAEYRIPCIWLNVKQEVDCVYPDDFDAGYRATTSLVASGCRSIAYVCYACELGEEHHYSYVERREGYERAMGEAGLQIRNYARHVPLRDTIDFTRRWLRRDGFPDGIVSYSPIDAGRVWIAATAEGKRIPEDIQLRTFEDEGQRVLGPPPPVFVNSWSQVGLEATRMLLDKVSSGRVLPGRRISFEFNAGETEAPSAPG